MEIKGKSNGRGGKRSGSGRKAKPKTPGEQHKAAVSAEAKEKRKAKTVLRTEVAMKALTEGISPLDVMLGAMRKSWELAEYKDAAAYASAAAPYVHPRLATVQHEGNPQKPVHILTSILDDIAGRSRGLSGEDSFGEIEDVQPPLAS